MRKHLKIVERKMSAKEWDSIDYSQVPSYAMKNYKRAFKRHNIEGFSQYEQALSEGKTKVNASVLYPYDLVEQYIDGYYFKTKEENIITEEQWKALPNYVQEGRNILIMADISGSMEGRPLATSLGLATYFAQRNKGDYHNLYMLFASEPQFINIKEGNSLFSNLRFALSQPVGYSTNLHKAYVRVLEHAIKNHISNDEMPKAIIVVSDMEIDSYRYQNLSFFEDVKRKFEACGYSLPKLVLWNVAARNDTFLSNSQEVIHVSGQSASVFKQLCGVLDGRTAWDFMFETLEQKMYERIKV
jgi:uncharacterized protein with von Willebrand factor type A (vWA) domain